MKKYKLRTHYKKLLADAFTPISIYLHLRDQYEKCLLLESSDYHGDKESWSFIGAQPLASFMVDDFKATISLPDGHTEHQELSQQNPLSDCLQQFVEKFDATDSYSLKINNGFFGYMNYDAVQYCEDIVLQSAKNQQMKTPDVLYFLYRYIIAIDHSKDELYILENRFDDEADTIDEIESLIRNRGFMQYPFALNGDEHATGSEEDFLHNIERAKLHCRRGDVFQVVLSRSFYNEFTGDEFNVYRALRTVNPSPYLFYCDFGDFRIFGSSPEAQIVIEKNKAEVHPIAGTFRRTDDNRDDEELAAKLKADVKENAEHTMLVDLARNDLNINCNKVKVERLREVQFFSHVIHLVSRVSGELPSNKSCLKVAMDSFPAGTLSGAPKYKAMQIIDNYESEARGFYGGCIGFFNFKNEYNHAIMIRTFLSKNNKLFYQAGAGIVEQSVPASELQEVNNKLAALKSAMQLAETI